MIAASLGVSSGMETSGASAAIANGLVDIGRKAGGQGFVIVGEWGGGGGGYGTGLAWCIGRGGLPANQPACQPASLQASLPASTPA